MKQFFDLFWWQCKQWLAFDILMFVLTFVMYLTEVHFHSFLPATQMLEEWIYSDQIDYSGDFLEKALTIAFVLFIYGRRLFWFLDNRSFCLEHPMPQRKIYFVAFFQMLLSMLLLTFISELGNYSSYLMTSHSLQFDGSYSLSYLTAQSLTLDLMHVSLVCFLALLRPYHYVAGILFYCGMFYGFQKYNLESYQISWVLFALALLLVFFGQLRFNSLFQAVTSFYRSGFRHKVAKFLAHRLAQSVSFGFLLVVLWSVGHYLNQNKADSIEKLEEIKREIVTTIVNRNVVETKYYMFSFDQKYQSKFNLIKDEVDPLFEAVAIELGVKTLNEKIPTFLRESEVHASGLANVNHVTLNMLDGYLETKEDLLSTLRHELAHVLIDQITEGQLHVRNNILSSFLHEGLAELVQQSWKKPDEQRLNSLALNFVAFDKPLVDFISNTGFFNQLDYSLYYEVGQLFWFEFVEAYGISKLLEFLHKLGVEEDSNLYYSGMMYFYKKASEIDLDMFRIVSKIETDLKERAKNLAIYSELNKLKYLNPVRYQENGILFTLKIDDDFEILCRFREKKEIVAKIVKAESIVLNGNEGKICKSDQDFYRVSIAIRSKGNWSYQAPWKTVQ